MPIQHKPSVVQPQNALNDLPEMPGLAEAVDKRAQVTALDQQKLDEWWRQVREMLRRNNGALLAEVAALAEKAGIDTGSVEEAPNDGQQYARQSRDWSVVEHPGEGGVPEAPINNLLYARRNARWQAFVPGGTGGGIPEAPVNGKEYVRRDADWWHLYQPLRNYDTVSLANLPDPNTRAVGDCFLLETGGDKWGDTFHAGDMVTVHFFADFNENRYLAISFTQLDGGSF